MEIWNTPRDLGFCRTHRWGGVSAANCRSTFARIECICLLFWVIDRRCYGWAPATRFIPWSKLASASRTSGSLCHCAFMGWVGGAWESSSHCRKLLKDHKVRSTHSDFLGLSVTMGLALFTGEQNRWTSNKCTLCLWSIDMPKKEYWIKIVQELGRVADRRHYTLPYKFMNTLFPNPHFHNTLNGDACIVAHSDTEISSLQFILVRRAEASALR